MDQVMSKKEIEVQRRFIYFQLGSFSSTSRFLQLRVKIETAPAVANREYTTANGFLESIIPTWQP